ncbi:MAG TPA: 3-hydroxy-3-methylglutaryl-CoA reductase, partial [Candidatus Nanoarchaeia archaeon]|nr:3-hydroxy-3-methylglutaryl-CoA reductase [Candidatus Nanoarchaeia archaeon]
MLLYKNPSMNRISGITKEEILQKVVNGEIKFHEIDNYLNIKDAVALRKTAVATITGTDLDNIGQFSIDEKEVSGRNIENMIGAI